MLCTSKYHNLVMDSDSSCVNLGRKVITRYSFGRICVVRTQTVPKECFAGRFFFGSAGIRVVVSFSSRNKKVMNSRETKARLRDKFLTQTLFFCSYYAGSSSKCRWSKPSDLGLPFFKKKASLNRLV